MSTEDEDCNEVANGLLRHWLSTPEGQSQYRKTLMAEIDEQIRADRAGKPSCLDVLLESWKPLTLKD